MIQLALGQPGYVFFKVVHTKSKRRQLVKHDDIHIANDNDWFFIDYLEIYKINKFYYNHTRYRYMYIKHLFFISLQNATVLTVYFNLRYL